MDTAWGGHPEWIEGSKAAVEKPWRSRYAPVVKTAAPTELIVEKPSAENSFLAREDDHEDAELPALFDEHQNYLSADMPSYMV